MKLFIKMTPFVLLLAVFLTSCGVKNAGTETVSESSEETEVQTSKEETTLDVLPENEYDEKWETREIPKMDPDLSKPVETEDLDDGSEIKTIDPDNSEYHDMIYYDAEGNITGYRKETYFDNGLLDCIYVYDVNMKYLYCCAREYDPLQRYYRYYYYNSEGNLSYYETLKYDGYGNQSGPFIYDKDGNLLENYPELN